MRPRLFLGACKRWLLQFGMEKIKNVMDKKPWLRGFNYWSILLEDLRPQTIHDRIFGKTILLIKSYMAS